MSELSLTSTMNENNVRFIREAIRELNVLRFLGGNVASLSLVVLKQSNYCFSKCSPGLPNKRRFEFDLENAKKSLITHCDPP
jgi:hypothetical protein